jgi:hypothetical protein
MSSRHLPKTVWLTCFGTSFHFLKSGASFLPNLKTETELQCWNPGTSCYCWVAKLSKFSLYGLESSV